MNDIIIRNVQKEDIPDVVDIQISGWKSAYKGIIDDAFLLSLDRNQKIEKRNKDYNQNGFIVAQKGDEIVGFCRFIDNNSHTPNMPEIDCEIAALYVKPECKYMGIGTKLFEYVTNEFKKKNKKNMILWCLKDNEPSKRFYTKMGGKITHEKPIEFGNKTYLEVGFKYHL